MPNIAFFDFDGTITHSDSFTKFVIFAISPQRRRAVQYRLALWYLGYKLKLKSPADVRRKVLELAFEGESATALAQKGLLYSEQYLPTILRDEVMQQIHWHKQQGDTVVVVSASMDVYLRPWCQQQGLELICSEVESCDDRLTGRYVHDDCSGDVKKQRILEQYHLYDYQDIYAYGDTQEDLAMLSLATHKIYQGKPLA